MAKINHMITIAIDSMHSAFHFYTMIGEDKRTITHKIKNFKGGLFTEEFWARFKRAVKSFAADLPADNTIRKITVVLPDCAVLTDTIKVPTLRGFRQTQKTLDVTLGGIYRNYNDLQVSAALADQNKLYTTFSVAAIQKRIAAEVYTACSENHLLVDTLTYASSAAIGGLTALNPKLKNESYLFLDVKDVYATFVFVADGKATGFYSLPFGLEFLRKPKITQEDMLFDHSYAELIVLNAREKAKAKKLTVMATEAADDDEDEEDEAEEAENTATAAEADAAEKTDAQAPSDTEEDDYEDDYEDEEEEAEAEAAVTEVVTPVQPMQKLFVRKSPRKLPKFMQREVPETAEGILYENFRIFLKWAMTLIQGNERLVALGKPEHVYVNLPNDLIAVLDRVNRCVDETKIPFEAVHFADEDMVISANLELYGGFYPKLIGPASKF